MLKIDVYERRWPMREPFAISRTVHFDQPTIIVTLTDTNTGVSGRGEGCGVMYAGETPATMMAQIASADAGISRLRNRRELESQLPIGGARCAVDCALWDLEARRDQQPAWKTAGLEAVAPLHTAHTIGIRTLDDYEATAARLRNYQTLKVKVAAENPIESVRAVRRGAPDSRLIVDPNQAWSVPQLKDIAPALAETSRTWTDMPAQSLSAPTN